MSSINVKLWLLIIAVLASLSEHVYVYYSGIRNSMHRRSFMLRSNPDDDVITGTAFIEEIFAIAGTDTVYAFGGADYINGDEGHDFIDAGPGMDIVDGGYEDDTIVGDAGHDRLEGNLGDDLVSVARVMIWSLVLVEMIV